MKKLKLLLFSVSPFIIGYLLNYGMIKFNLYGAIVSIISILFFAYWFFAGYKSYDYIKTAMGSIFIGNSFAIVSILLIIFQEVVLGRYMFNIVGFAPQMFYLPMIRFTVWVERILLFFVTTHYVWVTHALSFILMMSIYYAGYSIRLRKMQRL